MDGSLNYHNYIPVAGGGCWGIHLVGLLEVGFVLVVLTIFCWLIVSIQRLLHQPQTMTVFRLHLYFHHSRIFIECDTTIRALNVLAMKDATHISTILLHLLRILEI